MRSFKYLGRAIKEIRRRKKLTQAELARMIDVHPQFISNAERAISGLPAKKLAKLASDKPSVLLIKGAIVKDCYEDAQAYLDEVFGK